MPNYLAPGVYVEEVPSGARPIEAVGTSTAGFVGAAPDVRTPRNKVVAVNNWPEFVARFAAQSPRTTDLARAVWAYFLNGGRRCYVVNVGEGQAISGGESRTGVDLFEEIGGISTVAAPGYSDLASHNALLAHCDKMRYRFALLDPPQEVERIEQLTKVAVEGGAEEEAPGLRPPENDRDRGTLYYPWFKMRDPLNPKVPGWVAPSGGIAGIYARSDGTRGVHKAPANEIVSGALDVTRQVTREEQEVLNPKGVNVIRFFEDSGIRVWGARTIANSASEWRYVNVRRLFNMIEESIERGTRWVVFEPNDYGLWKAIQRDVGAFLTRVWRDGALMGRTPEQAFFVQCDESTNTPDVIDAGMVVVVVGVAPVKPAKFVVFKISQGVGTGAEEQKEEGEAE